mgnify:CR=1 FL=1
MDDHIVVFGAGKNNGLPKPEPPVVVSKTGKADRQYRVVAISEEMGFSEPSEVGVLVEAPTLSSRDIVVIPKSVEGAYQYLIYSKGSTDVKFMLTGFLIAHPVPGEHNVNDNKPAIADALRAFYPTPRETWFNFFLDKTGLPFEPADVPYYIPLELPVQPRADFLRTKITAIDTASKTIKIRDIPENYTVDTMLFHDNFEVLQSAFDNYETIIVEKGRYPVFGNLKISKHPVKLDGGLLTAQMAAEKDATFDFQGGYGMELTGNASHSVISNFEFIQSSPKRMPAGGMFISSDGVHGAGILANRRASWLYCKFNGFEGVGHVVVGSQKNNTNANLSFFEKCSSGSNKGHGFYAGGDNANSCLYLSCSAVNNSLWGFKDESFLGNHFIACHADANYAPYSLPKGNNNRGTLISCYSENNQRPSEILSNTQVGIGGIHASGFTEDSNGLMFFGKRIHPFIINQGMVHTDFSSENAHQNSRHIVRFVGQETQYKFRIAIADSPEIINDSNANKEREKIAELLGLRNPGFLQSYIVLFRLPDDGIQIKIYDAYRNLIADISKVDIASTLDPELRNLHTILSLYPNADDKDFSRHNESLGRDAKRDVVLNLELLKDLCAKIAGLQSTMETITLENNLIYDQSIEISPRIEFNVGRQNNLTRSMAWSVLNPRGSGLMVFNRGIIFGINDKGRKLDYERKLTAIENIDNWQIGTYKKGDVVFDISGGNYFLFPSENFGVTDKVWKPKYGFYVGEIIKKGKEVFFVSSFTTNGIIRGDTGTKEPDWSEPGEKIDNQLIWKKWGTHGTISSDGKNRFERLGRKSLTENITIDLAPNEVKDLELLFDGAEIGDSISSTPIQLAEKITWNAFLKTGINSKICVVLRLHNHETENVHLNEIKWVFDAWKH